MQTTAKPVAVAAEEHRKGQSALDFAGLNCPYLYCKSGPTCLALAINSSILGGLAREAPHLHAQSCK